MRKTVTGVHFSAISCSQRNIAQYFFEQELCYLIQQTDCYCSPQEAWNAIDLIRVHGLLLPSDLSLQQVTLCSDKCIQKFKRQV